MYKFHLCKCEILYSKPASHGSLEALFIFLTLSLVYMDPKF